MLFKISFLSLLLLSWASSFGQTDYTEYDDVYFGGGDAFGRSKKADKTPTENTRGADATGSVIDDEVVTGAYNGTAFKLSNPTFNTNSHSQNTADYEMDYSTGYYDYQRGGVNNNYYSPQYTSYGCYHCGSPYYAGVNRPWYVRRRGRVRPYWSWSYGYSRSYYSNNSYYDVYGYNSPYNGYGYNSTYYSGYNNGWGYGFNNNTVNSGSSSKKKTSTKRHTRSSDYRGRSTSSRSRTPKSRTTTSTGRSSSNSKASTKSSSPRRRGSSYTRSSSSSASPRSSKAKSHSSRSSSSRSRSSSSKSRGSSSNSRSSSSRSRRR